MTLIAAVAATVTVVVAVAVLVAVLLVVWTSILIGVASRQPVSRVPVAPAHLALVVLPLLLGRVLAAGGVLLAVHVGGAAPRSLGTGISFRGWSFEIPVEVQQVAREFVVRVQVCMHRIR